jgi:hypothetical protein
MSCLRRVTRIVFLMAIIAGFSTTMPFTAAFAQNTDQSTAQNDAAWKAVPDFTPKPDAATLTAPDWAMSNKTPAKTNDPHFYQRCLQGSNPVLPPKDRRDMCACMDAKQIELSRTAQPDNWLSAIDKRHASAYEIFVTQVFAPCFYLEGFALGARECYRNWQFKDYFPNQRAFNDYCTCYANAAQNYMQEYAPAFLAAQFANPVTHARSTVIDPVELVMQSTDYTMYMYNQRQRCTRIYGYQVNE